MSRLSRIVAAAALVLVAVGCATGSTRTDQAGSPAQAAVEGSTGAGARRLIRLEARLVNNRDWTSMYRVFTPRFRASCSFDVFAAEGVQYYGNAPVLSTRDVRVVRADGDSVWLSYRMFAGGRPVVAVTAANPDRFTRVGDTWLDDLDAITHC